MDCNFKQSKMVDWSKEMIDLIDYMGDQQRQKVDPELILEDVKLRVISFLIDNKALN